MSQTLVKIKIQSTIADGYLHYLLYYLCHWLIIEMLSILLSEAKENKKIVFTTQTIDAGNGINEVSCSSDVVLCSSFLIPISFWLLSLPGVWTSWSPWRSCSRSCGDGTRSRMRNCINRSQFSASAVCQGPRSGTQRCNSNVCPSKDYRNKLKMRLSSVMTRIMKL